MGTRFTLHQFSEFLQIRNPAGFPYILIGGQAVNYWADRYLAIESDLQKHIPFTSEDIDFCGNREDVRHIAGQLKLVPAFPHRVAMTALAGAIPVRIEDGDTSIEIVRSIPGVTAAMVETLAVAMEWNGKTIRVLDPISLLICKVELALTVSQQKRQDVEHLKILFFCVRGFLREWLQEVETGRIPAKGWLGAVNRLVKLATSTHGRKAAAKFSLAWREILPLAEIAQATNQKISMFREKQLSAERQRGLSYK
ncbi:MAG: hypothetical protein WCS42_11910 [Verrucomicrobiota bacterium]